MENLIDLENQNNLNKLIIDIKSNLDKVFHINSRIIEILSEVEENINQESLKQMVNTRNLLIAKSVEKFNVNITLKDKFKNNINNDTKSNIENILTEINQQELIIKELFEKQLNILRTEVIKFSQKKNIKIYENN